MLNKQDPRYFQYSSFPKRQCAVTGAVDANGAANFMSRSLNTVGFSASASVPLVVTWANGFDPFPVDYAYKWTSAVSGPSGWTGFSNATHYLYIDYDPDTDTVSYGSTTVVPNDDLVAPSHGAGVHWFDQTKYKMYESVASVWTERIRVFVGECVSNGTVVGSVISYALNGKYQSEHLTIPSVGTQTIKTHNIGSNNIKSTVIYINKTIEFNYSVGDHVSDIVRLAGSSGISRTVGTTGANHDRINIWIVRGDNGEYVLNKTTGTIGVLTTATNWNFSLRAERSY